MAKKKTISLPTAVEEYLDKNSMFNIFGLVNLKVVRASTGCKLKDRELKRLVKARFSKEVAEEIEFI